MFTEPSATALEEGRLLFAKECYFIAGIASLDALPLSGMNEIAFAGRSNVGKSSLLNALTGRSRLARVSQTPGRTRQINFFNLGEKLILADLPGYGFARASKKEAASWNALVLDYLRGRPSLQRVILLIDSRRGFMPADLEVMSLMDKTAVSYQLVLTKADKLENDALLSVAETTLREAKCHGAAHPEILATSSKTGTGIGPLRAALSAFAETQNS
jgi:GTP-binding protein